MSYAEFVCAETFVSIFNAGEVAAEMHLTTCLAANLDAFRVLVPSGRVDETIKAINDRCPDVEVTDHRSR